MRMIKKNLIIGRYGKKNYEKIVEIKNQAEEILEAINDLTAIRDTKGYYEDIDDFYSEIEIAAVTIKGLI